MFWMTLPRCAKSPPSLRQIAAAPVYFFKPGDAIRARVSDNWDQPLNPELPHAPNPPYGAILYYHLSHPPSGEIKLQVFDAAGQTRPHHVQHSAGCFPTAGPIPNTG